MNAPFMVIAHGPDWDGTLPDGPIFAHDHDLLLAEARRALAVRQEAYPGLVSRGAMAADAAEADIAAWGLIVAEWNWIVSGEGQLPGADTLPARIAAIDLALERAGAQIARGGGNEALLRQVALVNAMRWQLGRLRDGTPAVHHFAGLTRRIRRSIDLLQRGMCPVCERQTSDPAIRTCTAAHCGLPHDEKGQPERIAA